MRDLQRSAGNAAVTSALRATRAGRADGVIQRAVRPGSSANLTNVYNAMVANSETFRALDSEVATNRPIGLLDTSALTTGRKTAYDGDSHTIGVPVDELAEPRLRQTLVWEMHNAANRGGILRSRDHAQEALTEIGAHPTPENLRLAPYYMAAYALTKEWNEWGNIVESELRGLKINFELAGAGEAWADAVDDDLRVRHWDDVGGSGVSIGQNVESSWLTRLNPDAPDSWRYFTNYLADMVQSEHTLRIDPDADGPHWVGMKIIRIVQDRSPESLRTSRREIQEFLSGRRRKLKRVGTNPFSSRSLVLEVAGAQPFGR
jgi:hypothetical protein